MAINYISELSQIMAAGGLTQTQLSRRLGVTFAALNRWLHGHAKPRPKMAAAIERLYKEIVGYPSITTERVGCAVRLADRLKRRGLWNIIAGNKQLQDELLVEHTYNSTSIEGTTFTKRETEVVIFDKAVITDKSLVEHLEVTNHAAVLRDMLRMKYRGPITQEFIKDLHKNLLQGIHEDAGCYSRHQRAIRGIDIVLTHPKDIPEEMGELVGSWKKSAHRKNLRDIADFHAHFELIHPFGDGNGRLGRLLMTFQCLQAGYPPAVIENARKAEYYEVLEYAQRKSSGPFVYFLADEMERTAKIIRKYI